MRYFEIISEAKPTKPLTPEQARKRAERLSAIQSKISDIQKTDNIKVNAQRKKIFDI